MTLHLAILGQLCLSCSKQGVQLKRLPTNLLDMATKLMEALHSYEVGFHLLPLPKAAAKSDGPGTSPPAATNTYGGAEGGWNNNRPEPYRTKGSVAGKEKQKGNKGAGVLPKLLLGRDNVGMDAHGRRLGLNYQMGRCSEVAGGAVCSRGWHLCCRKNCFALHPEKDPKKK